MKISHSGLNVLQTCGKKFEFSYIHKLQSVWKGSALPFGSAMDAALNYMLLNKDKECLEDSIALFHQEWSSQKERNGSVTQLETNEWLMYSESDYDYDLLTNDDFATLIELYEDTWEQRFEELKAKKKSKQSRFEDWKPETRKFWNHVNWMSLNRKGPVMIQSYFEQILPEIDEVLEVQKHVELPGENGDSIQGYVDFVIRMKDGRVIVMDNKTSSSEYAPDAATESSQLALYKTILNSMNLGYEVTHTGYAVLSKRINKNKTKICTECGYEAESGATHKTCNNQVNGKRCGGAWDVTMNLTSDTQLIISKPTSKFEEDLLTNINIANTLIHNGLYMKNYSACANQFGKPCEFRNLCHKGEMTKDLRKKD